MTALSASVLGAATVAGVAWLLLLLRPGWTGRAAQRIARHRNELAIALAGLLAVAAVDPLIAGAPMAGLRQVVPFLTAPALGARLALLTLVVVAVVAPVAADIRWGRATRGIVTGTVADWCWRAAGWLGVALAAGVTARGAADVWSNVLGGSLSPSLVGLATVVLGGTAPPGAVSIADPRLPAVLYWMAATGALAAAAGIPWGAVPVQGHRKASPRFPGPSQAHFRRALTNCTGGLLAGGLGFVAWRSAADRATLLAPLVWWAVVLVLWIARRRVVTSADKNSEGTSVVLPSMSSVSSLSSLACLPTGALLLGVLLLAVQLRWDFLLAVPDAALPLSLDAQSYFDEALTLDRLIAERQSNKLALFFSGSTWFREPFYIYLVHAWLQALGPQEVHLVFLSLIASVVWVGVSAGAIGALLGRAAGLLTALLLAVDVVWIRNSVVGLREEVTGILLVAAVAVLWSPRFRRRELMWIAPLLAGGAALTRLDALPCASFILLWAAVAQRWSAVRAVVVAGVLGAVLLPTFAGYARTRGDVAPAATAIATNNWKEEFKHRLGEPGFEPDRRVSAFEYVFRYHTPGELVRYTARGYGRIYGEEVFESHYYLLAGKSGQWGRYVGLHSTLPIPLIFVAGTLGLLWQRAHWRRAWLVPALCVVGVLPPIGFVAGVPGHSELYQARYAYMVAPFAAATLAWALVTGGAWLAGQAVT
ncbi:MAG: hypothetical protein M3442_21910, partial [Chloroflexota bacterium]|nr:hypothetical protein [Chloroflexota bacterium]